VGSISFRVVALLVVVEFEGGFDYAEVFLDESYFCVGISDPVEFFEGFEVCDAATHTAEAVSVLALGELFGGWDGHGWSCWKIG
jgi:hypothetical protein